MGIVIKCFQTPGGNYVYDRSTNVIFSVTHDEYDEIKQFETQTPPQKTSETLLRYQKSGAFQPNNVAEMKHPATDFLEHYTSCQLGNLLLQVTQKCNLRCSYCVYGGLYNNRHHANKSMSFETAKSAIDFYLRHSFETETATLSFYGGEPLLEFGLIVKCVEYFKENIERKSYKFGMTTNGTLLTPEVSEYLAKENFHILISLDGSQQQHDENRRFPSGEGSFGVIMKNIERIKRDYSEYSGTIGFNTVLNPKMDLSCVKEFFDTDTYLAEQSVLFSFVSDEETTHKWSYDAQFYVVWQYEFLKLLLMMTGKLDRKYVSKLVLLSHSQYMQRFSTLHQHSLLPPVFHHGGPCIPGCKKLFVTVDGALLPCEKCMESNLYFHIGSLSKGFNISQISEIINNGKITEQDCINCWLLRHCSICSALYTIRDGEEPKREDIKAGCLREENRVLNTFVDMSMLREHGYGEGVTI